MASHPAAVARDLAARWSSVPTDLLVAELARRQDAAPADEKPVCGSQKRGAYDTPLHVFALFLILFLSTVACGFPLVSRRASNGRRTRYLVFLSQHFGTGVLIATAFVHLLPTAFSSLTDPCLPYVFSEGYKPMPGLIAMVSALVVVALESYLTTRGAGHSHNHNRAWDSDDEDGDLDGQNPLGVHAKPDAAAPGLAARRSSAPRPDDIALGVVAPTRGLMTDISPLPTSTPKSANAPSEPSPALGANESESQGNSRMGAKGKAGGSRDGDESEDDDLDLDMDELDPVTHDEARLIAGPDAPRRVSRHDHPGAATPITPQIPPTPEEQKRLMLQCMLLEAGILFHSVFIGMAVSVATGPPFVVFLVAIAFHQTFEGLALGSRIAAISFPRRSMRPWLMVLAYGCTTPIGQAIGLAVHSMYDPMSQTGLLLVGFMNAISSGLLLFAGLVQLLAEDFLTEKSYKTLKGKKRRNAGLAVLTGAFLMALVGAFA